MNLLRPARFSRRVRACLALALVASLAACAGTPPATSDAPPLKTVPRVELDRYFGTWHEIARYPFGIQDRRCARDTTATYRALTPTSISVINRCVQADGTAFVAEGEAWILDAATNARLEVSFLPAWLRWSPVGRGDYWVIELAPDYSWVVIGEPQRRYLWILARTPQMSAATYASILARLPAHGYDAARLVPSPGR
ncbi:MAG: lipocalin family protein [Burkholderiaceae bacterium]|nr:lipocalin family protein [Burkholderiaceae bacterium]